ncbi:centrosomal protein of 89 kDa isoform X3 [Rhinatrema bivittatum]|uniref:centrosomal protein of 89 kDa isoform X3 n=1 Tax=Rhinatrema bivittatum TaxID=194408 RepID=UPI001128AA0A|nr:centrosomal protein of 89 kDa isoform X3 [Rhinatrema bivittatum]
MPFNFRRRSTSHFKHIAHGLVPAATVAPRPAVPRTPPPRSPNPSPERPRSALAAAILMTSLTGRTVAIPQPRQRSYSESDSTYREQKSYIEPYATAAELGFGDQWKVAGRGRLSSPEMSDDDFEAEDMVESPSDLEKESIYRVSESKDDSVTDAAIYAIPFKPKETVPSVPIMDVDASEFSSQEVASQSLVYELKSGVEEVKNDVIAEVPKPSQVASLDETSRRKNLLENNQSDMVYQNREEMQRLTSRNRALTEENERVVLQIQEFRRKIKGMRLKEKELELENRKLHEAVKNKHMSDDFAELLSLRQQAQELVDENDALKMTIHRLNVELSCYQTKYRPVSKEENEQLGGLPKRGPPPPWLLDMKYLSPLLLAYEDRMREKDAIILAAEEEMKTFKARVEDVVKENEQLHQRIERNKSVTSKECHLQVERDKRSAEAEDLMGRLASLQAQKKSLLLEKNDLTADNKTLEAELEMAQRANRKSQKKIGLLRQQVEEAMEKEMTAHQYLANLIGLAENIAQERDQLIQMAKGLETEKHSVLNKIMEGNIRLGRLEEKVKVYKKKAAVKLGDINHRLIEQEEDFAEKAAQYQRELKHLQRLLHDRQETLDEVLQQKRQVEGELEIVWESTSNENKRMKELLYKSLGKNTWNNNLEEIAQRDSVHDYDFNYCDVKFSSRPEAETE